MGFMKWLINGAGFDSDESDNYRQEKYNEKLKKREEKKKSKLDKNKQKNSSSVSSQMGLNTSVNPYISPEHYSSDKYDAPANDYGIESSNVGGYGSKNVKFFYPVKFEDVRFVINSLGNGDLIVLNLNQMGDNSQRFLDSISGSVFALHGNLQRIDSGIFFLAPEGYNIKVVESNSNIGY